MKKILLIWLMLVATNVLAHKDDSYRNFWQPLYKKNPLNYCFYYKPNQCGLKVANLYCQQMGFQKANQQIVAYEVGVSRYLDSNGLCKDLACQAFKKIRCVKKIIHTPQTSWYYRYRKFNYPNKDGHRIAWCYQPGKQCGKKTAKAFCRQMGYLRASSQQIDKKVAITQYLANQKLCFHQDCKGFRSITCYR